MRKYQIEVVRWDATKYSYEIEAENVSLARQEALRKTRKAMFTIDEKVSCDLKPRTTLLSYRRVK